MAKTKSVPMRMCVACREMKPKGELIRVVRSPEGEIFVDETGKAAGRGAYACKEGDCLKKINAKKLFNKTFSAPVDNAVYEKIGEDALGTK